MINRIQFRDKMCPNITDDVIEDEKYQGIVKCMKCVWTTNPMQLKTKEGLRYSGQMEFDRGRFCAIPPLLTASCAVPPRLV